MSTKDKTLKVVKEYYGETLGGTHDLKTTACCTAEAMPAYLRPLLNKIDDEVLNKFYGCGSPLPYDLDGCTVLDLGCGTGRDVYLLSQLVGEKGRVVGVDMTEEQLDVAQRHIDSQMVTFGYAQPNVEFKHGYIENLFSLGLWDNSVDVVVSNCVINLSPDKEQVFKEIFRVLKPGGELYFSDVFTGCRVPEKVATDPVLYGECLGGALYYEDFRRMLLEVGCPDPRVVSSSTIQMTNPEVAAKTGLIDFYSKTVRVFKIASLEDRCEDYGQIAVYKGSIPESPYQFPLDDHHLFISGKPMLVCGNTASMLQESRYAKHFKITGDHKHHYGLFDCSNETPTKDVSGCC